MLPTTFHEAARDASCVASVLSSHSAGRPWFLGFDVHIATGCVESSLDLRKIALPNRGLCKVSTRILQEPG